VAQQATTDRLNPGQWLVTNQSIRSPGGRFQLVLQRQGNAVLLGPEGPLWSTSVAKRESSALLMKSSGILCLLGFNDEVLWQSGTQISPGAFLVLQDDGNLVLYRDELALWASDTVQA